MERLTEWDEYGNADIIALSDVMPEIYAELSFSETNDLTDVLNRLAAYEDTGLEPEEVSEYQRLCDSYAKAGLDAKFVQFCIDATQNGLSMDRIRELAQAEKDGRLVVLPCKDDTVFTIEEDFFNCDQCKHKANARYQQDIGRISCGLDNSEHCPLRVEEHKAEGFEISFKEGDPVVSLPGAYGYEGLETYSGFDGKCYYTREEAEAAMKKMEEADNEAN